MESSRSYSRELRAFRRELFLVLPNHYQPPAPLPNYDELCGATVHQKNVHTGPTEFRGSSWARIYGWFTSGINASAKISLAIMTGILIRTGWVNMLYILSIANNWIPFMMNYRHYMTITRFQLKLLLKTPFPYCFVLELLALLGLPLLGYQLYPDKCDILDWNLYIGIVLSINTVLNQLVLMHFEAYDYKPFQWSHIYLPLTAYEEHGQVEKMLSVKEWGPFKITIANIGTLPIDGHITVVRMVYGALAHLWLSHAPVQLELKLREPLLPGKEITLIPETHFLPGAYLAPGLKCFGNDRGITVETFVYLAEKITPTTKFCVKRVQVFRRRQEEWKKDVEEVFQGGEY